MSSKKLKLTLFLFALNILIYWYYSCHQAENPSQVTEGHLLPEKNLHPQAPPSTLKPWPDLPSYLPWTRNTSVPFRSCEGYFGNGFHQQIDVLEAIPAPSGRLGSSGVKGWFRCFYSKTLRSSICEGGNIRMDPEKIWMSRGGEKLEVVMGRDEDEELPVFLHGAFGIEVAGRSFGKKLVNQEFLDNYMEEGAVSKHTMRRLIRSIRLVGTARFHCDEWVEEPTLLITRFEYANLFHTTTDWYSAYVASRVIGLPDRPHVVFVDGHCEAPMEEMWTAMFSSVRYAKSFDKPVCFRHAILTPLGYETPLFLGLTEDIKCFGTTAEKVWQHPHDRKTARLSEFGELIRAVSGLKVDKVDGHYTSKTSAKNNILFIRRENYIAHPRHSGKLEPRLSNEQEVFNSLKIWASNYSDCNLSVVNGLFAHMHMKDQVKAVQEARVIIGTHGAGLTHIMWALPNTVVVEIRSALFRRPHFALIARWRGLQYHVINLQSSYVKPNMVTSLLARILRGLGC